MKFFNPVNLLSALAFLLPFESLGSFYFRGIHVRISQIVLSILLIQVGYLLARRQLTLVWPKPLNFLILFLALSIISTGNALNLDRSIKVILFQAFTFSLAFLIPSLVKNATDWEKMCRGLFAGAMIGSFFGIYQFLGDLVGLEATGLRPQYQKEILGFPRVHSFTAEPLYWANFLLIPLALSFLRKQWLMTSLFLLNIFLTSSRGGILAAFILVASALILNSSEFWARRFYLGKALGLSVLLATIFFSANLRITNVADHLSSFNRGAGVDDRLITFRAAVDLWKKHPLLGQAPGNFGPAVAEHPLIKPASGWRIVNNQYLELLGETGLLGLMIFALFQMSFVKDALISRGNFLISALLAAWISIWAQYLTFSTLYITHVWFLAGLLAAVKNFLSEPHKIHHTIPPRHFSSAVPEKMLNLPKY